MADIIKRIGFYFFKKLRLLNYGRVVVKKINGVTYELDLSENIDSFLDYFNVYEKNTSRLLRKVIKPAMIVVEVGANVGAHI